MDNLNALQTFVDTTRTIRELNIPSKEQADALVRSAMRMVANDLSNGNLNGAKHTADQLEAVEKFLKRKVQQYQADRITQNIIAAGRYRTIREIGKWCIENVNHRQSETAGGRDINISLDDGAKLSMVTTTIAELGIGVSTYKHWLMVGGLSDDDFDNFIAPYLDENINRDKELYITLLYKLAIPAYAKEKPEAPLSLAPHMKSLYLSINGLRNTMQRAQTEIDKGETPRTQAQFIFDQFRSLVDDINTFMRHTSEMY
jgi:hypothetical protein